MKQKTMKIFAILMIAMMTITVATSVYATSTGIQAPQEALNGQITANSEQINAFGGKIVGTLQAIGIVISVAILVVLGIKYMMGSAEEKAEYKKTMIPYLVGAVLIFAAVTIANAVYTAVNNF